MIDRSLIGESFDGSDAAKTDVFAIGMILASM